MKWIFNKAFISQNLVLFYSYLGIIIFMIIIAILLVAKEIKKQNDSK